jgi:hypothetical protein
MHYRAKAILAKLICAVPQSKVFTIHFVAKKKNKKMIWELWFPGLTLKTLVDFL